MNLQTENHPYSSTMLSGRIHNFPAALILLGALDKIEYGKITISGQNGEQAIFSGQKPGPQAEMTVYDFSTFDLILQKSDIGLGEAYIKGLWSSQSVSSLIEFAILNKKCLELAMRGVWHKILSYKVKHLLNFNSRIGSRKNISAHYDLGNNFYRLWLDETMTYSSAYWGPHAHLSLAQAQEKKYELILGKLEAKTGGHILEIGCGWGGFAEFAAHKGFKVTGVTISKEQHEFSKQRIQRAGLDELVEVKLLDYRDITETFDHVVSIEMIEAVGEVYWPNFFKKVQQCLRPGGKVSIQSIVIGDSEFARYRKGTDFIQQYIFPGGMLPCVKALTSLAKTSGGQNIQVDHFGLDYARTLNIWGRSFLNKKNEITQLGYSDEFQKMWTFYLEYCEGAFRAGQTSVVNLSYNLDCKD